MKKFLALALSLVMALSLVACGGSSTEEPADEGETAESGETGGETGGSGKIGIAMPTKSLERWNRDGSYLQEQFESAGYEVELTYSDNDVTQQVNDIENLISDGVDLLIVAAIDGESLTTVLDSADEAGIPVFGSEEEQVRNGCVASESLDYVALGAETGAMAAAVLSGEADIMTLPVSVVAESTPVYSAANCAKFGITLPEGYSSAANLDEAE